jgi:hypothetical protein
VFSAYAATVSRSRLGFAALATALAIAQFRLVMFVFGGEQMGRCIAAARGVVDGTPHWRIYQSRILAPYLIDALAHVLPSFGSAYVLFCIAMLTACGLISARIGDRVAGRAGAVAALLAFHVAFALLLARPWLYAWDFGDALVFLVVVDLVVAERPWRSALPVLAIGLFNHEIANFIAIWIVADAVARWLAGGRKRALAWKQIAAGAACLIVSFAVVDVVRSALLVEEIGPKLFADAPADMGSSFYFTLGHNLDWLGQIVTHFDYSFSILVPVGVVAAVAVCVVLGVREPARLGGLAAMYLAIIASLFAFGVLLETRIYIVLIPLVVLVTARAVRPAASPVRA